MTRLNFFCSTCRSGSESESEEDFPICPLFSDVTHNRITESLRNSEMIHEQSFTFENCCSLLRSHFPLSCFLPAHQAKSLRVTSDVFNYCHDSAQNTSSFGPFCGRCEICQMEYIVGERIQKLGCYHTFHRGCLERWLRAKPNCPICRSDVAY